MSVCPCMQVGTWAGNLMLTHNNDDFPSDVYTIMEAVGAKVTIATSATASKSYSLQDFLSVAMTMGVIVSMEIPFLETNEQFKSFKVMPRAQVGTRKHWRACIPSPLVDLEHSWFWILCKPRISCYCVQPHTHARMHTPLVRAASVRHRCICVWHESQIVLIMFLS